MLAFSTLALAAGDDPGEGVLHRPESESAVLSTADYGMTWVAPRFVAAALAATRRPGDRLDHMPRGLCAHQDLWILRRGRAASAPLDLPRHPAGELDHLEVDADEARLAGWVEDLAGEPGGIAAVRALVDGRVVGEETYPPATPKARWSFRLARAEAGLDALVAIEARTTAGAANLLAVGTLRPFVA